MNKYTCTSLPKFRLSFMTGVLKSNRLRILLLAIKASSHFVNAVTLILKVYFFLIDMLSNGFFPLWNVLFQILNLIDVGLPWLVGFLFHKGKFCNEHLYIVICIYIWKQKSININYRYLILFYGPVKLDQNLITHKFK